MMSVLWLVPYGDNWGGVVERNGSICANNLHKQSPSLTPEAGNNKVEDCGPGEVPCQMDRLRNLMKTWLSLFETWQQTRGTVTPMICLTSIVFPPNWESHGNNPRTSTSAHPSPSLVSLGTLRKGWSPYDQKRRTNISSQSENGECRGPTLVEVQKLYGKLLHTTLAHPDGRPYLTSLEAMLGIFHDNPHLPWTPPRQVPSDLDWWTTELSKPTIRRSIPTAHTVHDIAAFLDASSSTGIAIVIGTRWRVWRLLPGWDTDRRNIGWAEAVGFKLLV